LHLLQECIRQHGKSYTYYEGISIKTDTTRVYPATRKDMEINFVCQLNIMNLVYNTMDWLIELYRRCFFPFNSFYRKNSSTAIYSPCDLSHFDYVPMIFLRPYLLYSHFSYLYYGHTGTILLCFSNKPKLYK